MGSRRKSSSFFLPFLNSRAGLQQRLSKLQPKLKVLLHGKHLQSACKELVDQWRRGLNNLKRLMTGISPPPPLLPLH